MKMKNSTILTAVVIFTGILTLNEGILEFGLKIFLSLQNNNLKIIQLLVYLASKNNNDIAQNAAAASISYNIEGAMVCPGEELILTCTGQGPVQRWTITDEDGADIEVSFSRTSDEQRLISCNFNTMTFEFALMSVAFDHFESMFSVVVTEEINNTRVECTGRLSRDSIVLTIITGWCKCFS